MLAERIQNGKRTNPTTLFRYCELYKTLVNACMRWTVFICKHHSDGCNLTWLKRLNELLYRSLNECSIKRETEIENATLT